MGIMLNEFENNDLIIFMQNPWDVIQFSGDSKIHLDSFLSVFDITGLPDEYYYNSKNHNF